MKEEMHRVNVCLSETQERKIKDIAKKKNITVNKVLKSYVLEMEEKISEGKKIRLNKNRINRLRKNSATTNPLNRSRHYEIRIPYEKYENIRKEYKGEIGTENESKKVAIKAVLNEYIEQKIKLVDEK